MLVSLVNLSATLAHFTDERSSLTAVSSSTLLQRISIDPRLCAFSLSTVVTSEGPLDEQLINDKIYLRDKANKSAGAFSPTKISRSHRPVLAPVG